MNRRGFIKTLMAAAGAAASGTFGKLLEPAKVRTFHGIPVEFMPNLDKAPLEGPEIPMRWVNSSYTFTNNELGTGFPDTTFWRTLPPDAGPGEHGERRKDIHMILDKASSLEDGEQIRDHIKLNIDSELVEVFPIGRMGHLEKIAADALERDRAIKEDPGMFSIPRFISEQRHRAVMPKLTSTITDRIKL